MCIKTNNRIECTNCGYPFSEARYPDRQPDPLPCDSSPLVIILYLDEFCNTCGLHLSKCGCSYMHIMHSDN